MVMIKSEGAAVTLPSACVLHKEPSSGGVGDVCTTSDRVRVGSTRLTAGSILSKRSVDSLTNGRKRAIAGLIVLANFVTMLSFGSGIGGGIHISTTFGLPSTSPSATWIAASYPLTAGAFILATGRLGTVYGHKRILIAGGAWWTLWSLANAFCKDSFIAFNVTRALSGIGGALAIPNAVAVVGQMFPPGRERHVTLGLFGAGAPAGGWGGAMLAGAFERGQDWKWIFICMAILGLLVFGSLSIVLPSETSSNEDEGMDWFGSALGIGALILFNFVWNQAPQAGWSCNYEIALLVLSMVLFVGFAVWESKFAAHPIMPLNIWRGESFFAVILVVLLSFMSYGTFIWYLVAWQQQLRHWSVLATGIGLIPLAVCSVLAAFLASWMVTHLSARFILLIGAGSLLLAEILLVTTPVQQSYWKQMFPATVLQSFCPDFIFTAAQIVACNAVGRREQGIAGSLIGTLQLYATSTGLGFAGIVESHTNHNGKSLDRGYRCAFGFGIGLAVLAGCVSLAFVKMPIEKQPNRCEEFQAGIPDSVCRRQTVPMKEKVEV